MTVRRRKPAKMGLRSKGGVDCEKHLRWLRGCECVMARIENARPCEGKIQSHHVKHDRDRDDHAIPACVFHHREMHDTGHNTFERKYKIDLMDRADAHWTASPHGREYRWLNK